MTEAKNLFNLPPDLFDLVSEKIKDYQKDHPEDPELIYRILCDEIEIQVAGAYEHPEEEGRFPTIMQCALTLELSLIHISEPTRLGMISYAVFCLKKKTHRLALTAYLPLSPTEAVAARPVFGTL